MIDEGKLGSSQELVAANDAIRPMDKKSVGFRRLVDACNSVRNEELQVLKGKIPVPLSLTELCQKFKVSKSEHLPIVIRAFIEQLGEYYSEERWSTPSDFGVAELIYSIHLLSNDEATSHRNPWVKDFSNHSSFSQAYLKDLDQAVQMDMHERIAGYTSRIFFESFLERFETVDSEFVDQSGRSWVKTISPYENSKILLTPDVLLEAEALIVEGFKAPEFSHSTTSSAVPGILFLGMIAAPNILADNGVTLESGELRLSTISLQSEGLRSNSSVYASRGIDRGSPFGKWFDEYPVTFGISESAQVDYLNSVGLPNKASLIKDHRYMAEGYTLGNKVPLKNITSVFCPKIHQDDVAKQFCEAGIEMKVISFEAVNCLRHYNHSLEQG